MRSMVFLAVFLFGSVTVSFAEGDSKTDANIGMHLYRSYCLVCHGTDGKGNGPLAIKRKISPVDLTENKYQVKSVEELVKVIGFYGRKDGSAMPLWKDAMPESNLRHLAAFIKRFKRSNLQLRGDERKGREIFKSACVSCHDQHGTGKGVLAELIGIKMVDFTDKSMKKISDEQLIQVIHDGKGDFMPPWDGTLNDGEIIDVGAYVRSLGR